MLASKSALVGMRRRGSVLVEFALIALVLYLILAATLEFGRALFGAGSPAGGGHRGAGDRPDAAAVRPRH